MYSDKQSKFDRKRPVNRRIMFNAILVVTVALGSYILREFYPEQPIIKWLFGGIHILFFWAVSVYIIHRIDILVFGKKDSVQEDMVNDKSKTIFSTRMIILALIILLLFIGGIKLLGK